MGSFVFNKYKPKINFMLPFKYALFVLLTLGWLVSDAQQQSDKQKEKLQGPVDSVVDLTYRTIGSDLERYGYAPTRFAYSTVGSDGNGNQVLRAYFGPDSVLLFTSAYKYDSRGNQVERMMCNRDGSQNFRIVYKYDASGCLSESDNYDASDSLVRVNRTGKRELLKKTISTYNKKGKLTRHAGEDIKHGGTSERLIHDGTLFGAQEDITYDSLGREASKTVYHEDFGRLYNNQGNSTRLDNIPTAHRIEYKYDEKGNLVNTDEYSGGISGGGVTFEWQLQKTTLNEFDKSGHMIASSEYNTPNTPRGRKTWEYNDKGRLLSTSVYQWHDTQTLYDVTQHNPSAHWKDTLPGGRQYLLKERDKYNDNGEITEMNYYDDIGHLFMRFTFDFDKLGNLLRKRVFDINGAMTEEIISKYLHPDSYGNWTTKVTWGNDDEGITIVKRKIKYNN